MTRLRPPPAWEARASSKSTACEAFRGNPSRIQFYSRDRVRYQCLTVTKLMAGRTLSRRASSSGLMSPRTRSSGSRAMGTGGSALAQPSLVATRRTSSLHHLVCTLPQCCALPDLLAQQVADHDRLDVPLCGGELSADLRSVYAGDPGLTLE